MRREARRKQDFGLEDVADTSEHRLIEQHFGDGRIGQQPRSANDFTDVKRIAQHVGAEVGDRRVMHKVALANPLDHRHVYRDCDPVGGFNHGSNRMRGRLPALAVPVEVPRAIHAQVRAQDKPVTEEHQKVLPCCVHSRD